MRLFIAIKPEERIIKQILALYDSVPDFDTYFQRITPDHLHVTVRFLGEVDGSKVEVMEEYLHHALKNIPEFTLETNDVLFGLGGNRLYLEIVLNNQLKELRDVIDKALSLAGIPFENTYDGFTPHISLSRANKNLSPEAIEKINNGIKGLSLHSKSLVRSIHLIKSEITPDPLHTTLFTIPLNPILT
jgi:RNA 2',3'-cyclic 3'-phosphodiesterase